MALREILKIPDKRLRLVSEPVKRIDAGIRALVDDMFETMYDAPGIGLAAPQVGIAKRIIVVHVGDDDGPFAIVNPVLSDFDGESVATEGCLSIPGKIGDVTRAEKCTVTGLDRYGKKFRLETEGLLARCFQHEVDHLDGVLIIDKATDIREAVPLEAQSEAEAGRELQA